LCDDDGNARASLQLRDGNPQFVIADGEGRVRVSLRVDAEGNSSFLFAGADGKARIGMDCYDEGPSFFLRDSAGNLRIGLDYAEETQTAVVTLASEDERSRLSLSCSTDDESALITLRDSAGRPRIELRTQGDDHSLSIINEDSIVETLIIGDSVALMSDGNMRLINSKSTGS
jgi:hypothetical protein